MRQANTTYVDLRSTLDDVDPLVEASKPVARRLGPYLDELRPFARDARADGPRPERARPGSPGQDNDLLELNRTYPPLADIAVDTKTRQIDFGTGARNVGRNRGAFPERARRWPESTPIVAQGRPYTPDFVGWLDDFSQTGRLRRARQLLALADATSTRSARPTGGAVAGIPRESTGPTSSRTRQRHQFKRCPGAAEAPAPDGSNVWSLEEEREKLDCLEKDRDGGEPRMIARLTSVAVLLRAVVAAVVVTGASDGGDGQHLLDRVRQRVRHRRGRRPEDRRRQGRADNDFELDRTSRTQVTVEVEVNEPGFDSLKSDAELRGPPAVADRRVLRRLRGRQGSTGDPGRRQRAGRADRRRRSRPT